VSNLSVGSGVIVIFSCWAHLTASACFRVRAPGPVSGRLSTTRQLEDWHHGRGFPLPFGRRRSLLGHPIPAGELGPPHGRLTEPQVRTPTGLPRSARTSSDRGGRPLTPGTMVLTPTEATTGRAPAASQRPVPAPRRTSHRQGSRLTRHQRGFTQFARPVFPLACSRPDGTGRPWAHASGFAPRRPRAGRRAPRWGQAIEHGPGTTRSTHQSISNPVVHSMRATSCRTSP
jgi:hypothetical protein